MHGRPTVCLLCAYCVPGWKHWPHSFPTEAAYPGPSRPHQLPLRASLQPSPRAGDFDPEGHVTKPGDILHCLGRDATCIEWMEANIPQGTGQPHN